MSFFSQIASVDFAPFLVSLKLALITTFILFFITVPIAWKLSQTNSKIKPLIESIAALPLVLPPTVLGFYILMIFSPRLSPIGIFLNDNFDVRLVFNFTGLIIASSIYSFPFMLSPLQSGFESLNKNMLEASYISGKSGLTTLFRIALPNIKPSLITALVITFAHTMGEFGVVLLVGGNIGEQTRVASIAIYEAFEVSNFALAHIYSAIMLFGSFIVLLVVYMYNKKYKNIGQQFIS